MRSVSDNPYREEARGMTEDELHHWLTCWQRDHALAEEIITEDKYGRTRAELVTDYRAILDIRIEAFAGEVARRERAAALGVPCDQRRYPDDWLADLKRRADLPALVTQLTGVTLRQTSAQEWRGPCPICRTSSHSDALAVRQREEGGVYHCFRLDHGGDAIHLVMQVMGLDFSGAVELLARLVGLAPPKLPHRPPAPIAPRQSRLAHRPSGVCMGERR